MKRLLTLISLSAALLPATLAIAQSPTPFLVGQWNLQDKFSDFKGAAPPIGTDNTVFVFMNPTPNTLTLEYAFFGDKDGTFCGCDRDTLSPNGRVRYSMLGEKQGGQFSSTLCPTQTDGVMKTIVFIDSTKIGKEDVSQAGIQIHTLGQSIRTESDLISVPITATAITEMNAIHGACNNFIK